MPRPLNININQARISKFMVTFEKELPQVNVWIDLLAPNGSKIAEYSLATNSWNDKTKFDLPFDLVPPINDIANVLERIVTLHCQATTLQLPEAGSSAEVIE